MCLILGVGAGQRPFFMGKVIRIDFRGCGRIVGPFGPVRSPYVQPRLKGQSPRHAEAHRRRREDRQDVGRARQNPAPLGGSRADLAEVAGEVCSVLAGQALRRGQSLSLDAPDSFIVAANRWWLEVLLRNLVDNALRYTPDGGTVRVVVDPAGGSLRVEDDGPGIPPGLQEQMLTRFARGPDQEAEGCGLGLSIVARIVRILGAGLTFGPGLVRDGRPGLAVAVRFATPMQGPEA